MPLVKYIFSCHCISKSLQEPLQNERHFLMFQAGYLDIVFYQSLPDTFSEDYNS